MMPEPDDYSVAALRWFASRLPEISQLPSKTALSIGLAIRAVLANVTLADDLDVRTIEADDVLNDFEDATTGRYTVNTRQTYRNGFHRGLELLQRWQEQDPSWDTGIRRRIRRRDDGGAVIAHTFPVREGITTRFALPGDLTSSEADRLISFIRALVVKP